MRVLKRVNDWLERFVLWFAAIAFAAMAVIIPYEVLGRKVLGTMPTWSGEVSCFALVWVSMFGGAGGLRRGYHVGMEVVVAKFGDRTQRVIKTVAWAICLALLAVLLVYGVRQVVVNARQVSPALRIPMAIPYAAIPAGAAAMISFTLEHMIGCWRGQASQGQGG